MTKTPEEKKASRHRYYLKNRENAKAYRKTEPVKAYYRKYYQEHRERMNTQNLASMKRREEWIREYKRSVKCSMCNESFPDCPGIIEFHHPDGEDKVAGVGRMGTVGKARLMAEIAKCIPVCANCHRRLHQSGRQKKKKGSVPVPESLVDDVP